MREIPIMRNGTRTLDVLKFTVDSGPDIGKFALPSVPTGRFCVGRNRINIVERKKVGVLIHREHFCKTKI